MALRIGINGAAGRMGQRLVALAASDSDLQVVAALEQATHPKFGLDAGAVAGAGPIGVPLAAGLPEEIDVVIDFSVPEASAAILATCLHHKVPLVVATTGLDAEQRDSVRRAAEQIPLLWAPSMSLAVNLAMKLAETAAGRSRIMPPAPTSRSSNATTASKKTRPAARRCDSARSSPA